MKQDQFLEVLDEAEAHRRFDAACAHLQPRVEELPLFALLGRVLAGDMRAPVDVPGFDRSNVDGFAVRAADTFGASETAPVALRAAPVNLAAGVAPPPDFELAAGQAAPIATGGALPRGADAVVMVEYTTVEEGDGGDVAPTVRLSRAAAPGEHVAFAGSDIGRGEVVLRRGHLLTSRDTALLAAVGLARASVLRRPRVAILSTGDEVRPPGLPLEPAQVYDSNARVLADAVREHGAWSEELGIVSDDAQNIAAVIRRTLVGAAEPPDVLLLSGGTSKGAGDVNYGVIERLAEDLPDSPGIVVHGVALKPGKPICLAVLAGIPVIVLPGFPTSAIFTYHEFVAPLLRRLGGQREDAAPFVDATAPLRIESVEGRTQYTLVGLVPGPDGPMAYPLGAGSGSVSGFSRADGFLRIPSGTSYVPAGAAVQVRLLGKDTRLADVVAIGSHCLGLDLLLGRLAAAGFATKSMAVGSVAGLRALERGEGDVAGVHLFDPDSGTYNVPFLPAGVVVIGGYARRQGVVFRPDDARLADATSPADLVARARAAGLRMVNRNAGSGTRVLIDRLLGDDDRPDGYLNQARSHHAVAAAVAQGRADWGVTLDILARDSALGFLPIGEERYDLVAREDRLARPAVAALRDLLADPAARAELAAAGLVPG